MKELLITYYAVYAVPSKTDMPIPIPVSSSIAPTPYVPVSHPTHNSTHKQYQVNNQETPNSRSINVADDTPTHRSIFRFPPFFSSC